MIRSRRLQPGWRATLLEATLLGLGYYVAAQLSLGLALVEENITPLWPPTGIALVGLLVRGRRLWPGIALAALAVNLPISATALAAAVTAVGNTLAPVAAVTLLLRTGFHPELDRLRDALGLVFPAALLSTLISATIGAGALVGSGAIPGDEFPAAWSVWWAGDAMGILVVAPFLLTMPALRREPFGKRLPEAVVLFVALVAISLLVLFSDLPIMFAALPVLGWAAWRFQQRGAAPAALIVSLIATWAVVEERGQFAAASLPDKMITLQFFNVAVALTSFVFAAMVTERNRTREALERAAVELEDRVRVRTAELSSANRQLAEAQSLAQVGSWEWDLATGIVTWSSEMYRIHGIDEDGAPITFERVMEFVEPEDRGRIEANVVPALERGSGNVPEIEYRIARPDGSTRLLLGRGRVSAGMDGGPGRMVGTVQDVTERRLLEREHRIADTLQRALLPAQLPRLDGVALASRYVPAEQGSSAGGDWYDVIELPDGRVALVIGDVAGHGTQAASVMGQVRMAVRAYSLEGHRPEAVVGLVSAMLRSLHDGEQMVTLLYVVLEPATLELTIVNAGHPPPLVIDPDGGATYLESQTDLPVGLTWELPYQPSLARLTPGSTLVLFTDGLIDRRDLSVEEGLARLSAAANADLDLDVDALCATLVETLVPEDPPDDVAILAARFAAVRDRLHLEVQADPPRLGSIRRRLARWLRSHELEARDVDDLVLACSEACANAMEHAYGPVGGPVEVEAGLEEGQVVLVVRDRGRWRAPRGSDRGRGLMVIDACTDHHEVRRGSPGTEVRMRKSVRTHAPA